MRHYPYPAWLERKENRRAWREGFRAGYSGYATMFNYRNPENNTAFSEGYMAGQDRRREEGLDVTIKPFEKDESGAGDQPACK